jgi:uncharacterized membrane protein
MTDTLLQAGGAADEQAHTRRYVGVIVVEVLAVIGIWLVQRYFGS